MDTAIGSDGEVQQQRGIAAYGFIIGVHQFRQALHVFVLCIVVEPARTDACVRLTRTPHIAVLHTIVQHLIWRIALVWHQAPVRLTNISRLSTYPAQVTAVASVVPNQTSGLQYANHLVGLRPLIVSRTVNLARLVGTTILAVATVGPIEPHLEDVAIVRQ